jgi:hypothetical protein
MRELSAEARLHLYARSLSRLQKNEKRAMISRLFELSYRAVSGTALYGALALIAAIIFGTLSVHPF